MASTPRLRVFIALELPDGWKLILQEEQRRLESAAPGFGRWVAPELMHLTLLFLGSQPPTQLPAIESAVDDSAHAAMQFELRLDGLGSFGGPRSLRVVLAGVRDEPTGALADLRQRVVAQTQAHAIPHDEARFSPHITLARARRDTSPAQAEAMHRALAARQDWARTGRGAEAQPYLCREIVLVRSDLRPGGPLYTSIYRAPLGG